MITYIGLKEIGDPVNYLIDFKLACRYVAPYSGNLNSIKAYLEPAGATKVILGVYSDKNESPYELLASSEEIIELTTRKWYHSKLDESVPLTANKYYWLTVLAGDTGLVWIKLFLKDGLKNQMVYNKNPFGDWFSATFGDIQGTIDKKMSIYGEYSYTVYSLMDKIIDKEGREYTLKSLTEIVNEEGYATKTFTEKTVKCIVNELTGLEYVWDIAGPMQPGDIQIYFQSFTDVKIGDRLIDDEYNEWEIIQKWNRRYSDNFWYIECIGRKK